VTRYNALILSKLGFNYVMPFCVEVLHVIANAWLHRPNQKKRSGFRETDRKSRGRTRLVSFSAKLSHSDTLHYLYHGNYLASILFAQSAQPLNKAANTVNSLFLVVYPTLNLQVTIDIVLDNAGFEIVTDLVLAEFFIQANLASRVRFYPKRMPWFVSDVTPLDFDWTLKQLQQDTDTTLSRLSDMWRERMQNGSFVLEQSDDMTVYWTLPDAYFTMKDVCPALYRNLSESDLIIFKGDLNYRKLVGDLDWPHTTTFRQALRGFTPSALVSLRALKANVVVGLRPGQAEMAEKENEEWMVSGKYGVIQALLA